MMWCANWCKLYTTVYPLHVIVITWENAHRVGEQAACICTLNSSLSNRVTEPMYIASGMCWTGRNATVVSVVMAKQTLTCGDLCLRSMLPLRICITLKLLKCKSLYMNIIISNTLSDVTFATYMALKHITACSQSCWLFALLVYGWN